MLIRSNILPRTIGDACVTTFLLIIIPIIYYFELFVVLPKFYIPWSSTFLFHFMVGNFILFNVCSNLVGVIISDTSIRGRILPTEGGPNWRFCSVCESVAPPRSWHCSTCNICILKRDHHCIFTSCCIGLHNHRYFIVFVFYIFIATIYGSYYNLSYIRDKVRYESWTTILKFVFPLAAIFVEWTHNQIEIFLVLLVVLGGAFTGALLYYHVDLMVRGCVTHERRQMLSIYDQGIMANVKTVLGNRWYLVLLSPFIESVLPVDGLIWNTKQSTKGK